MKYPSFVVHNDEKLISVVRGKAKWHDRTIRQILENEKYMGDALLQKTYTKDFLQKKRVKNNGIMPQYYVEDSHPAIIPKELFLMVQEEISRRSMKRDANGKKIGHSANHCFSQRVFCVECGEPFRRVHWNNRGKKSIVWRCTSRLDKKGECHVRTINEETLKAAFVEALNKMQRGRKQYISVLESNLEKTLNACNTDEMNMIESRLEELQRLLIDRAGRHESYSDLADEIFALREKKEKALMDDSARKSHVDRITELRNFIQNESTEIEKFDEKLVQHMLSKVTIFDEYIAFEFKSGISIEVNM